MTVRETLDSHDSLFLEELCETAERVLRILVAEGKIQDQIVCQLSDEIQVPARPVEVTPDSMRYRIVFSDYVAYAVRDESYASPDSSESFIGNRLRTYSKSHFLTFTQVSTLARSWYPGPYVHYQLVCVDHVIDVAALEEPIIHLDQST